MKLRVVALAAMVWVITAGCTTVKVAVPPEADLQGIKTVAVTAADMASDPSPVGVLLRSEASSRIRRLLPVLTLVEPTASSDAHLHMTVLRHNISSVALKVYVDPKTGQVSCAAYQIASLLVDAGVTAGETIRWQGVLEASRRIDLPCVRYNLVVIPAVTPSAADPRLVRDVVDELGRRLAGYVRTEIRAIQNAPPTTVPAPARDP